MEQIITVTDGMTGDHEGPRHSAKLIVRHLEVIKRKLEVIAVFLEEFNCIVDPELHDSIWTIKPCTMMDNDDWDWHSYCNSCRAGMPCEVAVKMVETEMFAVRLAAEESMSDNLVDQPIPRGSR